METLELNAPIASKRTFSKNIQYLMRQKGIDVDQLAVELDIEKSRISPWLNQACYPKIDMLVKVCLYFGVTDKMFRLLTESIIPEKVVYH